MLLVIVRMGSSTEPGIVGRLPDTSITAIVSPMARPIPSTTPAKMVFLAAAAPRKTAYASVLRPAPAPLRGIHAGTALIASIVMVMTVGKIIMERMMMAASIESPLPPMEERINGTSNTSPKNPYTTDGMPAKRSMQAAGCAARACPPDPSYSRPSKSR